MKAYYSHCPKCQSVLTQEEMLFSTDNNLSKIKKSHMRKGVVWKKFCNKHLSHTFSIVFDIKSDMSISAHVSLPSRQSFVVYSWYFADQKLQVTTNSCNNNLPWFEPEFKDWNKLINKLKTYTLFL